MYNGLARTIYIRCIYGIFGREITEYMVIRCIYGSGQPYVYKWFWPTLPMTYIRRAKYKRHRPWKLLSANFSSTGGRQDKTPFKAGKTKPHTNPKHAHLNTLWLASLALCWVGKQKNEAPQTFYHLVQSH